MVDDYSIWAWQEYLTSFSMMEWAETSAPEAVNGRMWSVRAWYEWYRAHLSTWSGLVWTRTFLNITPNMVARMLHAQRRWGSAKSKL